MAVDLLLFGAVIKSVSQTQTNKTIKSTVTVVFLKRLCFSAEHRTRQRNAPKIYMTKLRDAPYMINLTPRGAGRWGKKLQGIGTRLSEDYPTLIVAYFESLYAY